MVKRYNIAGIEGTTPPGWHEYVPAVDYDALAVESEARYQSCLVLMKSVTQHRARIATLEALLRRTIRYLAQQEERHPQQFALYTEATAFLAALAPESPKGG